jgi:hypothetical protein
MSRTYRARWEHDDNWNWKLNRRARDASPRSHRYGIRCMCSFPRDKWHKKRFRRAVAAGATQQEAKAAREW